MVTWGGGWKERLPFKETTFLTANLREGWMEGWGSGGGRRMDRKGPGQTVKETAA